MSRKLIAIIAAIAAFIIPTLAACSPDETGDIVPHLIVTPDPDPVRPIQSAEKAELSEFSLPISDAQYRDRVNELYRLVVDEKKQPVFRSGDPVEPVYAAAKAVLDRYVLNAWHDSSEAGELNIVHTVHDYLVYRVQYDFDLFEQYRSGADVSNNPAFGIDGVFLNNLAVCDGLASAFNFLCAMEDITCVRVTGTFASVPHAWNKVRVGGVWYNVDVTADCANYVVNDTEYHRQLSHGYFLLSDYKFKSFRPRMHVFESGIAANADYNYYDGKTVTINGVCFPRVVTSQDMLNRIFSAISESREVGKIELKLAFPGKTNVNDGDMYKAEIDAAYACLDRPDYTTENQRPYFQSPDGVYLFLMYK